MNELFGLPFIREAQGPLAWLVTLVSLGLLFLDRLNKIGGARAKKRLQGSRESVDRFEAVSEAEARLREVYERDNGFLRGELKALRDENKVLTEELATTKSELATALRQLADALASIEQLKSQMGAVQRSISENGH